MSGRSARRALLALALLLAPALANARGQSFYTGSPFGLGIVGGLENHPESGFQESSPSTSSSYASYFGFEPFFDLGNIVFRAHVSWHFYPLLSSSGTDSTGNSFTQSSDAGSLGYGLRAEMAPWIDHEGRSRIYFVIGVSDAVVRVTNLRKYTTGANAGTTFRAALGGSGVEVNGGLGFETFLLQNWSIAFEGGYTSRNVGTFHYRTSTDETGASIASGATATDANGGNRGFHAWTPYGQVVLNLNL